MKQKLSTTKLVLILLGLIFVPLIGIPLVSLFWPAPAIVVSPETTYVTGPLDDEGRVDYLAALEQKYFADLPPEENAAREYVQAFAPGAELKGELRRTVFERLDLPVAGGPPYLENAHSFAGRHEDLFEQTRQRQVGEPRQPSSNDEQAGRFPQPEPDQSELVDHWQDVAQRRPWTSEVFPLLAAWLDDQQTPLAHIHAGAEQQRCYFPLVSDASDEAGAMMWLSLYYMMPMRGAGRCLSTEAMQQLGNGDRESAWQNIRVMLVMARHTSEQPSLIGNLVGIAVSDMGLFTLADVLHFGEYTEEQLARMVAEFDQIGRLEPIAEEFRGGERLFSLDMIARHAAGEQTLADFGADLPKIPGVDPNVLLRQVNEHYDRMEALADQPPGDERDRLAKITDEHFEAIDNVAKNRRRWLAGVFSRQARSEIVADILCAMLLPAVQSVANADDRYQVRHNCARAAIALAQYRAAHGEYPERLAQLVPEFAEQPPQDLFTGQPLKYLRTKQGYQLYSVGPNRQDNGGLDATQDETDTLDYGLHDDWGLTVPRPLPVPSWEESEVLEEFDEAE